MTKETFISFDEYKARLTGTDIDIRSVDDILCELNEVEKKFEKGDNSVNGDGNI